jgi:hypothetical protein
MCMCLSALLNYALLKEQEEIAAEEAKKVGNHPRSLSQAPRQPLMGEFLFFV